MIAVAVDSWCSRLLVNVLNANTALRPESTRSQVVSGRLYIRVERVEVGS